MDEAGAVEDERREGRGRQGAAVERGREPDPDGGPGRAVHGPTVFSTFSGIGGMDLGLERAGFRVLAFSEIEPYPSAVLAHHWPDIPNLGDIVALARRYADGAEPEGRESAGQDPRRPDWFDADLWTGGFPCQDLSIAGKRRGLGLDHSKGGARDRGLREPVGDGGRLPDAGREPDERPADDSGDRLAYGTRSGLAFAFLDLLRAAQLAGSGPTYVLLENVPGLLSSHGGRDMAAILGALCDLGYGVAYRTVDARYTGVPQRRRRVFILGVRMRDDDPDGHLAAERAAEILALTASGCGHSQKGREERPSPPSAPTGGPRGAGGDIVRQAVSAKWYKGTGGPAGDEHHNLVVGGPGVDHGDEAAGGRRLTGVRGYELSGSKADARRDREVDGTSRRLDDSPKVVGTLREHVRPGSNTDHTVVTYSIVPEGGQGADLRATEVETAPSVTTEDAKQSDRGVRVVGAFNSTGGTHSVDYSEEASPPVRVGSGLDIPSPPAVYIKKTRPHGPDGDGERWDTDEVSPTINQFDSGDSRAVTLVAEQEWVGALRSNSGGWRPRAEEHPDMTVGHVSDDESGPGGDLLLLLPPGLDSHRYRACGNAVVVNVAEWLGRRIMLAIEGKV